MDIFLSSDVEGMQNYIAIQTKKEKLVTLISMKSILDVLPAEYFIQTHKSYVVSISKIEEISENKVIIDRYKIPLSKRMKNLVINKIVKEKLLKKKNKND